MRVCISIGLAFTTISGIAVAKDLPAIEWVSDTGSKLVASLVPSETIFVLRTADGKEIRVPYERLSERSRQYAARLFQEYTGGEVRGRSMGRGPRLSERGRTPQLIDREVKERATRTVRPPQTDEPLQPVDASKPYYTVSGSTVTVHNTEWGAKTFEMDFPTGSAGGVGTIYVGAMEPRIKISFNRAGVQWVKIDGNGVPKR